MRFFSQIDLFNAETQARIERPGDGGPARLRIPLLPEGTYEHEWYGLLRWTPEVFSEMIRNFERRVTGWQPMLNFDHSTHNPFSGGAPAAGWIVELIHTAGEGLDAVVELTDLGEEAIERRRYRYISAEVADAWSTSEGETHANVIIGAALTNMPFHDTMRSLFSDRPGTAARCFATVGPGQFWAARDAGKPAQGGPMTLFERVRRMFNLPDTATEADAVAALEARAPATSGTPAPSTPPQQQYAAPPGTVVLSAEEVATLRRQAQEAEEARRQLARRDAEGLVGEFIREGKVLPAQREAAVELALSSPDQFKALFTAAKPQVDLTPRGIRTEGDGGAESFSALVDQLQRQRGIDFATAARQAAQERPDLYEQHRASGGRA